MPMQLKTVKRRKPSHPDTGRCFQRETNALHPPRWRFRTGSPHPNAGASSAHSERFTWFVCDAARLGPWRFCGSPWFSALLWAVFLLLSSSTPTTTAFAAATQPIAPATPKEFFNAGTQKLREGKLREAEAFLESVLAAQRETLQPPTLYNLGHVRFGQGAEELKKGPAGRPTAARGRAAALAATDAIASADEALASNDVQKMVAAYMRGRGVRKELKAATKAVQQAMQTYGTALARWQRSEGDFKSTVELTPSDTDAQQNVDAVDRCIAKLVDTLHELQQAAGAMGDKTPDLGDKLRQLKGKIPAPDMPPGAAGDEEDDEDFPKGTDPAQKEGPTKEGQEMELSPEQAGWLLDAFRLDSERRLPMGQNDTAEPKDRNRPTW